MSERRRVGLDVSSAIDPRPSGVARYIHGLVDGIEADGSWDLTLFCRSSRWRRGDPRAQFGGRPIVRWLDWRTPSGVSIFHSPDLRPPRRPPANLVVTVHDLSALDRTDHARPKFIAKKRAQLDRIVAVADQVITHTETMRRDLVERTALTEERVSAVPLWAGLPPVAGGEADARTSTLLLIGGPSRRKGSERIVEFLRAFDDAGTGEPWTIDWCGSATPTEIETFAATLPPAVCERIRWRGHLSDGDLDRALRKAGAFVQLSQTEGFGIPLLESAQRGCPVIVARCPTAEEVLPAQCAFFWSEDESAGLRTFFDENERRARVARSETRAGEFSRARTITETLHAYERTLTSRVPTPA